MENNTFKEIADRLVDFADYFSNAGEGNKILESHELEKTSETILYMQMASHAILHEKIDVLQNRIKELEAKISSK